ncbi:DUF3618 domain-containing protein [Nocardia lijiangensis]|uniref:DUF3618 domain-containing protein n=1 Tax=Nocardia lijiangensis TaxID=299618 RepID=UPI00082E898A|nr:DUF3618 domain-containing protein [Nocardia lijiangensis]
MSDMGRPDVPNISDAVRRNRDRVGRRLGETVGELTGKFDVPTRAEDKMHQAADAARHRAADARHYAHDTAEHARAQVEHLVDRAAATAPPVAGVGKQVVGAVRGRPVPIAAVAVVGVVLIWWITRRRRA